MDETVHGRAIAEDTAQADLKGKNEGRRMAADMSLRGKVLPSPPAQG